MKSSAQLQKAIELENRGLIAEAMSAYRRVLEREPGNIDALVRLGRAQLQQGQIDASAKTLGKAVTLRPQHALAQALLGVALSRAGQVQDALACFERAVEAQPTFDTALIYKADALAAAGRATEAVVEFDRALAINARNFAAWTNRGIALEALGRDVEAAASFQRALALSPDLAEAHFSLANVLHRLQRYDEATKHYRRTIARWPDFVRAHANLGGTLFKLRRWEESLQSLREADRLQPNVAKVHEAIGHALRHLDRDLESLQSFDKALAIDPNDSTIMASKAGLLYALGRIDEARKLTEAAIALKPRDVRLYLNLSEMKRFAPGDPHLAAMQALLPDLAAGPDDQRIDLHFALAKAYGDLGEAENSFHHLAQGNALRRRQFVYDENAELAGMERIARTFTPELMRGKAGQGHPSNKPIFIVGMPRSGTTLVEQILASHPRVFGAGERKMFEEAYHSLFEPGRHGYPDSVAALTPEQLNKIGTAYLARMAPLVSDRDRFTDKLPANYTYVGLIHLALPNARIVQVRRDPVDTCLSIYSKHFEDPPKFAYELGELGRFYRAYEQLMDNWRRVLPPGVMIEVQYEDVVADIEGQTRRILAHCGLEFDAACLAFHKAERTVRTASAAQVRQPIYKNAVGRWRPYRDQLRPLFEALGISPD